MTNKEAIEQLQSLIRDRQGFLDGDSEHDEIFLEDIQALMVAVSAIKDRLRWIPCSERLPEELGDYLISIKRFGWNCEEYVENDIAYWDDIEGFHKADKVIAWMPLPEPYRGGE